ncbi:MAG: sigma-70 family RNA polymerase sigma factor [Caldicoprobacteraceae bacterium]|jgi:RNA polymerase sigma-B factor
MGVQVSEKEKPENLEALLKEYCDTRDITLRNKLLKEYLYIAEIIAKKFVNRGVEYDDLFQIASLALLKALERYDINKGYKFSSFATPTIIGEIKNYFRDRSRIIRLPRKESELIKKLERARQHLTNTLERSPKPEEIAEYLKISTEEVLELMESSYKTNTISLDYYIDDGDTDLSMLIGQEEKNYSRIEDKDLVEKAMEKLNDLERKVIYERFFNERSQRDIAEEIGVSQMYISRLERRVLQRLKQIFSEN